MSKYIFQSERLGFRNWLKSDEEEFHKVNSDPEVMKYFPSVYGNGESLALIKRMQKHFKEQGYTYYATELLTTGQLIGFIGLAFQEYDTDFNPSTDIGWRLNKSFWGKGYATEGAKRCLKFGFETLNLESIVAVAAQGNLPSIHVMKKIGMKMEKYFDHPNLLAHKDIKTCVLYRINRD